MNSRFAEACPDKPLDLNSFEAAIERLSVSDNQSRQDALLTCQKDIYIGVFFDGTNNNKYRDRPSFSESNVARLYEIYPGTPAQQAEPVFRPRVLDDRSSAPREIFRDSVFKPDEMPPENFQYYRKIYVPGVGTPMPNVGDTGGGLDKTFGLAGGFLGQARLEWTSLQLVNQIHAAIFNKVPLEASVDLSARWERALTKVSKLNPALSLAASLFPDLFDALDKKMDDWSHPISDSVNRVRFEWLMSDYESRLAVALKRRGTNKPELRKIRLSVFGFSRGAAAARAWVNLVNERWGSSLQGIPLQIDFLGIFDTVASVGIAQSTPKFEGHAGWGHERYMAIPPSVKRCAHLVAGLEVRGSFPLDSVCHYGSFPSNCKEIVYPGVHSDVGGGYAPGEQGRALGGGAAGDSMKLSQIPLAQMYREARMAGVPLVPEDSMKLSKARFQIAPALRDDFNAYVEATRTGRVPPTLGKGEPAFARMYPTETQPRGETFRIIRHHYEYSLHWRKSMLPQIIEQLGVAELPNLPAEKRPETYQDIEDLRGAETELKKEIEFLRSKDPKKFYDVDDPDIQRIDWVASQIFERHPFVIGPSELMATTMRVKQREWDLWLREVWGRPVDDAALPRAASRLFELHAHDSRAWFKPGYSTGSTTAPNRALAPNDEDWFVYGGRLDALARQRAALTALLPGPTPERAGVPLAAPGAPSTGRPPTLTASEARVALARLDRDGEPLIRGGREPYRAWGYLRHRIVQEKAKLNDPDADARQTRVEAEEKTRIDHEQRRARIDAENRRFAEELKVLKQRDDEQIKAAPPGLLDEVRRAGQNRWRHAEDWHQRELQRIGESYPSLRQTAAVVD